MLQQINDAKTTYIAFDLKANFLSDNFASSLQSLQSLQSLKSQQSPKSRQSQQSPIANRFTLTLTLITGGEAIFNINDNIIVVIAPCLVLSSWCDKIVIVENHQLAAKSLSFHPTFINKSFTPEKLCINDFNEISDEHDYSLVSPFIIRNEVYNGTMTPFPQPFVRISEWFDMAYKESKMKNDSHWLHRVRRYLFQILFELEDINSNDANKANNASDESIVNMVLEYIHGHFSSEISLDTLCKLVYLNRTSLTRKFKERTRRTLIDYLLHHRLTIACELLTHSSLNIGEIAEMTGFKYESYFTKQFKAKIGTTPTQYRQSDGFETLNTKESGIIDEF